MQIKGRWIAIVLVLLLAVILLSCSNSSSVSTNPGTGFLWLTAQGNTTVQAYTIDLANGALNFDGSAVGTANGPTSILITPKGDAIFVCGNGTGPESFPGGISAYTINTDGSLKVSGSTVSAGLTPTGMAINPAGTFLFVANQGSFDLTQPGAQPGSISVFAVSGATLTPVGPPFPTEIPGATLGTGPVSVAVSASGNFLFVANQFANTVTSYQISSTGTLTQPATYPVGTAPSSVSVSIAQGTTQAGLFLYVANTGSNNISAFAICDVNNGTGCSAPNGVLIPVTGSPFPAEPGPVAIAMDPSAPFLYVADEQANQISEYSWSAGTGALTALATPNISAAGSPVSFVIRAGVAATSLVAGTDYMYVANLNGSSISVYTLNTSSGALNVLGSPITTFAQPSAITAR